MKRLISLALALVMIFSLTTVCVFAKEANSYIEINGEQYLFTATENGEGWSYGFNASTKVGTLILSDYEGKAIKAASFNGESLVIEIVGTNVITATTDGISVSGADLTIKGDGKLTVNAESNAIRSTDADVVIDNGTINLNATESAIIMQPLMPTDPNGAALVTPALTVNGGKIKAVATNQEAVKVEGTIDFEGGYLQATTSAAKPAIVAFSQSMICKNDPTQNYAPGDLGITNAGKYGDDGVAIYDIKSGTVDDYYYYDAYEYDSYSYDAYQYDEKIGEFSSEWSNTIAYKYKVTATSDNVSYNAAKDEYAGDFASDVVVYFNPFADGNVIRTFGSNRYRTAVQIAETLKTTLGVTKFDTIIVAYANNFADALAGSYLAAQKDAPILLVDSFSTKTSATRGATMVRDYIKANLTDDGTIYILGGDAAVSTDYEDLLVADNANATVKRLAGSNRYGTNLEILKECDVAGKDLLVCAGTEFADALSVSATGMPIMLVRGNALTSNQKSFLSTSSINDVYVIGGEAAVSADMLLAIENEDFTCTRIAGKNRYKTSIEVAKTFFPTADTVTLATGVDYPDGLCGGSLAYAFGAPVILIKSDKCADAAKLVSTNSVDKLMAFGGTSAIADKTINNVLAGEIIENAYN